MVGCTFSELRLYCEVVLPRLAEYDGVRYRLFVLPGRLQDLHSMECYRPLAVRQPCAP